MKYKSMVTTAFLMIPFFLTSSTSAEIFEQVHDYDFDAQDIESADFNNDGLQDFAVTDWIVDSSYYEIFLSNGDCSFTRLGPVYVDTSDVRQLLTGDFNEDSNEDLLMMSLEETWLYTGDGTGVFTLEEIFPWSYCSGCIGDVNLDDHLDLIGIPIDSWVWWEAHGDSLVVMPGDGAGGFTEGWVYESLIYGDYYSCQLANYDIPDTADNILDMCVPCCEDFLVFQGIGDGTFSDPDNYIVEISPSGAAYQQYCTCGDFDEDNYTDIAVAGNASMSSPSTFIFLNQQDGTFIQKEIGEGYFSGACGIEKVTIADLDLDSHLDLSLAGAPSAGSIAGYGDGIFNIYEPLSGLPDGNNIIIDMDSDGDLDLADRLGNIYMNTTINLGIEGESEGFITNIVLNVSPNPFSGFVNVEVSGYPDGSGNLQIFDLSGRLISELEAISTERKTVFHWNGVSSSGDELPSGIYTARLYSGLTVITATLLKLE